MKIILLVAIAWITSSLCIAQQVNTSNDFNLGFENTTSDKKLPDHWFQWGSGYKISLDTVTKHGGKYSALIEPMGEKSPNTFGCIATGIPSKYDAKEIELRAYMKYSNVVNGPIGLMIRIDGESGVEGFENMQGRNIQGTKDWSLFSVKIPYPERSSTIFIGAILSGEGKLWVDDLQILLDGRDIREAKIKTPKQYPADQDNEFASGSNILLPELTQERITDLQVMGQIWGFLKYYHPSVAKGEYNWDYELFRILPKIIKSKNAKDRNSILNEWVKGIGATAPKRNFSTPDSAKLLPDFTWINPSILGKELTASLNSVRIGEPDKENYYIALANGVGNPVFKNERSYVSMDYKDAGFRLLSLFRYWNMINYFFPYKNLIDEDWNAVLREFIPKMVNAKDELQYKLTVLALIARIHDTHANIWGMDHALNSYKGLRYAAVETNFIEGKAVVTDFFDEALGEKSGLKIGDIINAVDGKNVDQIIKENLHLTPASNYPTQLRNIARDLLRSNEDTLQLDITSGTEKRTKLIQTFGQDQVNVYARFQKRDTCFRMMDSAISYIYPGTLRNEFLPTIMDQVNKTKGLIIDFRCYPSDFIVFTLSEYLLPAPKSFVKFSVGSITTPGLFTFGSKLNVGRNNPDYYKGKVVIIVNETTQSSAEYQTMGLQVAPKAVVIGSTTAAADGNVSKIILPGNLQTMISGIGVYYPDGRETQRVGIVPDIEVKPSIQGIREGRDELLERAISIINDN